MMADEIITLPVGATAEPDTCGSCKFFRRLGNDYPDNMAREGLCKILLPPTLIRRFALKPYVDGDENRDRQLDTGRCDLHKADGKKYIVQRKVG